MNVYLVTSGQYSDYGIRAIFSTKEGAQAYIDKANTVQHHPWGNDECEIEEWSVDELRNVERVTRWEVRIRLSDGRIGDEGTDELLEIPGHAAEVDEFTYANGTWLRVRSYKSADHALKLATEARQNTLREQAATSYRAEPLPTVPVVQQQSEHEQQPTSSASHEGHGRSGNSEPR